MTAFFTSIRTFFTPFGFADVVDICVVGLGIYFLLRLVQGTRAVQLIKGFVAVAVVVVLTDRLQLKASHQLLVTILQNWLIALIILFQPELRMVVEQIGRGRFIRDAFRSPNAPDAVGMVNEIVRACRRLSEKHIGALIAIEREVGLNDIISTGRRIAGTVSSELLQTIFHPGTPMHDGGIVVQGQQLAAAMCLFPLTSRENHPRNYGTRHRAALGLSELTDAVIIVVSEETGTISLAIEGQMISNLSTEAMKERLLTMLTPQQDQSRWFWRRDPTHSTAKTDVPANSGEGQP